SNKVKVPFTITAPAAAPAATVAAPEPANASVKVATTAALGDVLVDANGRTLYLFEKDQGPMSACTGACLGTWLPAKATGSPTVGAGLNPALVGSVNGQVTYAGHL